MLSRAERCAVTAPDLPSAGTRSPAEGSTTGWVSPSARLLSLRRHRAQPAACTGGAHWFRAHPDQHRTWRCTRCGRTEPFAFPSAEAADAALRGDRP